MPAEAEYVQQFARMILRKTVGEPGLATVLVDG